MEAPKNEHFTSKMTNTITEEVENEQMLSSGNINNNNDELKINASSLVIKNLLDKRRQACLGIENSATVASGTRILSSAANSNSSSDSFPVEQQELTCPRIFDGWNCWNETKAGSTSYSDCPFFVPGFVPTRLAHKECLPDGTWYRHPDNNHTWSNYTNCLDLEEFEWHSFIITFYETGYFISVCALIISLIIFCSFKSLECTRVRIHKHLFVSFIINNVLWMAWYRSVVNVPEVPLLNPSWCIGLHIVVHYFMVANYFWMFNEGFYLHTLLVLTFLRSDSQLLKGFYIFGWIGPIVPIIFYVYCRGTDSLRNQACWMDDSHWNHILSVPVFICLFLSLAFLINIVRVLVRKLKDNQRNFTNVCRRNSSIGAITDNHLSLRKAVRATLILIPLLGLHYLLTPFRPEQGTQEETVYEVVAAITASLQGFCVALLFCFCNSEVITVCRRSTCCQCSPCLCGRKPIDPDDAENNCSHPPGISCAAPTSMSVIVSRRISDLVTEDEM